MRPLVGDPEGVAGANEPPQAAPRFRPSEQHPSRTRLVPVEHRVCSKDERRQQRQQQRIHAENPSRYGSRAAEKQSCDHRLNDIHFLCAPKRMLHKQHNKIKTKRTSVLPTLKQCNRPGSEQIGTNIAFRTNRVTAKTLRCRGRNHLGSLSTTRRLLVAALIAFLAATCWLHPSAAHNTLPAAYESHLSRRATSMLQLSNATDRNQENNNDENDSDQERTDLNNHTYSNTNNDDNAYTQLQSQQQQQQSFSDWWNEFWSRQPFPSGYTQSSITLIASLLTTIIFLIVVGNLLVCIAIFTEKSLKPTQNWFIASLAVSDMLLGLVVMPFSLARELMGFWIFGSLWCDIHEAVDVLLTTASINTLCLISLDRYWSITQAVSYLKKRTPRRGAFMIAFVWVFSAAVSLPPLFGWKKQTANIIAPAQTSSSSSSSQSKMLATTTTTTTTMSSVDEDQWSPNSQPAADFSKRKRDLTMRARKYHRRNATSIDPSEAQISIRNNIDDTSNSNTTKPDPIQQISIIGHRIHRLASESFEPYPSFKNAIRTTLPQVSSAPPPPSFYLLQEPANELQQQQEQTEYPSCQLSDDIGYVLYSALGSFYIPCAVMVFTYIKIFLAARSRARRTINKQANAKRLAARRTNAAAAAGGNAPGATGKLVGETLSMPAHAQVQAGARAQNQSTNSEPLMRAGKLVIVERRKSIVGGGASPVPPSSVTPTTAQQVKSSEATDSTKADCTLTTSSARPASASVLCASAAKPSASIGALAGSASADTSVGNESSLITVMSASMSDVPITRFNFNRSTAAAAAGDQSSKPEAESSSNDSNRAAALLQAISKAADTKGLDEILAADEKLENSAQKKVSKDASATAKDTSKVPDIVCGGGARQANNQIGFNSTNETCFMTIEEDSDTFDGQTGRTLTMIAASTGGPCQRGRSHVHQKSHSSSSRVGSVCHGGGGGGGGGTGTNVCSSNVDNEVVVDGNEDDNETRLVACNNAACLRRQQQRSRSHHHARSNSSYCGSSMTINDDDDEDEEDVDEEDEVEVDEDDDDESIGDDLLTDDCNGYSVSCALDQFCSSTNAPAGSCPHCEVCNVNRRRNSARNELGDESNSSPAHLSVSIESPVKHRVGDRQQRNRHHRRPSHPSAIEASPCQHNNAHRKQSRCPSDIEAQSLTGDDNLSLDEDEDDATGSSSASGHDMLDATEHKHKHHTCHHADHSKARAGSSGSTKTTKAATSPQQQTGSSDVGPSGQTHRKKSSLGLRLTRLGSSVPPLWSNQSSGLIALAAASQQQIQQQQLQQQQTVTVAPVPSVSATSSGTRNLKALRQNFFLKLNQLAAKSAAKQTKKHNRASPSDKSSMQRSYEHSVDGATTSNAHSYTEYPPETTLDDYDPQTSGESKTSGTRQRDSCAIGQVGSSGADSCKSEPSDNGRAHSSDRCIDGSQKVSRSSGAGGDTTKRPDLINSSDKNDDRALLLRTPQMRDTNSHLIGSDSSLMIASSNTNNKTNNNISGSTTLNLHSTNNNKSARLDVAVCKTNKNDSSGLGSTLVSSGKTSSAGATLTTSGGPGAHRSGPAGGAGGGSGSSAHHRAYLASDNERHKRKLAKARERRATLILGLIMAAFICSWLPFFTFYVLRALCTVCREYVPPRFEAFIFWMGYCNSAINPIIYTIFNRDFRKAFRKILFKCL